MNRLDEKTYEALKLFANKSRKEVNVMFEKNKTEYTNTVPDYIEDYLTGLAYIAPQDTTRHIITPEGIVELRKLEEIYHRERQIRYQEFALVASLVALGISFLSIAIANGWI